ncbi:MAG: TlpA family protein disulfide reductase [Candidatus Omnitrophica bacterium]|nr:TlpA family protein disulfide reductase [Candidatus Omnitrophota bacterium]
MDKYIIKTIFIAMFAFLSLMGKFSVAQDNVEKEAIFAQDFTLQDTDNYSVSLSEYKGVQPVVLFFWTSWCAYCRQELRILKDKYAGFSEMGIVILAINIGEQKWKVEHFKAKNELNFKVLLDKQGEVADSFGVFGVPTYIFINKEGRVVAQEHYFSEERFEELVLK